MLLTDSELKKIVSRRDPRYDGKLFFGVITTKIFCRPTCPAKPKLENIVLLRSQAEAHLKGFRPCKRCHSDLSPGSKLLEGTPVTIDRALKLIDSFDGLSSIPKLALKLGMTDRHLRRLFNDHLGASPIDIITVKKLQLAKQLLIETNLSVTEISSSAGFKSIRRFNEAFKSYYQLTPSELKKKKNVRDESVLKIMVRKPYDWNTLMGFFQRHELSGIEYVENHEWIRHVSNGKVTVGFDEKNSSLLVKLENIPVKNYREILRKIRFVFDVDQNPAHLPLLDGIRIPGSYDGFETAVSVIMGQLISTKQATRKMKLLIDKFGINAKNLVDAEIETIGITKIKASAIRELSRAVIDGKINLNPTSSIEETKKSLLNLHGVGNWTAEIISMRCLGDANAFPGSDLVIKKFLNSNQVDLDKWNTQKSYLTQMIWRQHGSAV